MNGPTDAPPETPSLLRRRRPFLAPIWLLGWAGIAVLIAAFMYWNSANTTTLVLIRHAEKQLGAISDAPLAPPGEQRATRLAQMFGDAESLGRIRRIYVTNTRRTQQTAAELAQRLDLKPVIVPSNIGGAELARQLLRENRGGIALVVSHSNTVPETVAALAHLDQVPPIAEEEYDTMYIVSVPTIGKAQVLRLKY